jgi:glycine/D-amino acid oxidase-like deaminating enzyme
VRPCQSDSKNALKHGAYSATAVLPGEDEDAFRELHQKIIAELAPVGALEEDLVGTIARLLWRKQNLAILRIIEFARQHGVELRAERPFFRMEGLLNQTREELGEDYNLVEIGETATVDRLLEDLQIEERLDATIDKCLKRLLFLRGIKSLLSAASSASPQPVPGPPRIPGPKNVA